MSAPSAGDRTLPVTRGIALAIVPFLVVAFAVLYPVPSDTGRLFAWKILPSMTAMLLGSVYLGGAYFFLRVGFGSAWHAVEAGFPPVGAFATLMGVATVLHWGKFNHHHVAFWLWVGLYFTTPFLIFGVWLLQRRRSGPRVDADPRLARAVIISGRAVGLLASATAIVLFVVPARAITAWPWMLTPLTARVVGAIFALGIVGLTGFGARGWSELRILVHVAAVMLTLILVAVLRARDQFDTSKPLTWLFVIGFLATAAAMAWLYAGRQAGGSRPRRLGAG